MTFASIPSLFLRSKLQVVRGAAAPGCCGVVLRRRAGGPRWVHKLSRHTPQTRCFTFVWHHSVMRAVISLRFTRVLRCVFARHVSAHHSMLPLVCRLIGNSTFLLRLGCCAWAAALGLLEVRVVYTIFARHKPYVCAFSCGFSICNSLLSVLFRFWVPWSSHAVRFCSLSGVGSVSSRQPYSTFGSSISTVEVCSFSFSEVHFACRCAAQVFF